VQLRPGNAGSDNAADLVALIPNQVWAPAYDADGQIRDGA